MYKTDTGEEIFIIDGHTHFWDGSPANHKNVHGKQFIDCFYGYHNALSPEEELWPALVKVESMLLADELPAVPANLSSRVVAHIGLILARAILCSRHFRSGGSNRECLKGYQRVIACVDDVEHSVLLGRVDDQPLLTHLLRN